MGETKWRNKSQSVMAECLGLRERVAGRTHELGLLLGTWGRRWATDDVIRVITLLLTRILFCLPTTHYFFRVLLGLRRRYSVVLEWKTIASRMVAPFILISSCDYWRLSFLPLARDVKHYTCFNKAIAWTLLNVVVFHVIWNTLLPLLATSRTLK